MTQIAKEEKLPLIVLVMCVLSCADAAHLNEVKEEDKKKTTRVISLICTLQSERARFVLSRIRNKSNIHKMKFAGFFFPC